MSVAEDFHRLSDRIVDDLLAAAPVAATWLGDHRFDDRLPDHSVTGVAGQLAMIDDHLTALDAVDDVELDVDDLVDLEILRARLLEAQFDLAELRSLSWDPMRWNPGTALYLLVSREAVPEADRAQALRGRLGAVPDLLADARAQLDEMSGIHVQTAIGQLAGTIGLIEGPVRALVGDEQAVGRASAAVQEFRSWLEDRLPESHRSPRLGGRAYEAALWHGLDEPIAPTTLLTDALSHLATVTEQLRETAAEYGAGVGDDAVRRALADVADSWPVDDRTVLPLMADAVARTTAFVREHDLVGMPDVDVQIIEMPEIHRGVAVAYCDAPGPLETAALPTFVAVSPTPADWDDERVRSFYREYNGMQLHDLAVHEAMPGHVLQLAHSRALSQTSRARRLGHSGVLVEGWAVLAEELMIHAGYQPTDDPRAAVALRLQQLKMQARMTINAILDVGVHAQELSEAEALDLMRNRGFQEEGEAVGKWRRALLTAAQLPTYFVGYRAMRGIAADLQVLHPDWPDGRVHDLMLAHGSPAPRHLRLLLGI